MATETFHLTRMQCSISITRHLEGNRWGKGREMCIAEGVRGIGIQTNRRSVKNNAICRITDGCDRKSSVVKFEISPRKRRNFTVPFF